MKRINLGRRSHAEAARASEWVARSRTAVRIALAETGIHAPKTDAEFEVLVRAMRDGLLSALAPGEMVLVAVAESTARAALRVVYARRA